MAPAEVAAFLAAGRKLQLATANRDGSVHLVTMFYTLVDGRIAFWTYRSSQKARNLARDPRVTCLVEDGEDYFELRGVQVRGVAEPVDDPTGVRRVGAAVAAGLPGVPGEAIETYVAAAAAKRVAYVVAPHRVASWDHRKLVG